MRYFYCSASLLLLRIVTGFVFDKAIANGKNDVPTSSSNCEIPGDAERWKRSSQAHNHRGQRQVGYFETSGENNLENDFANQDMRSAGLRDDEKLESDVNAVQSRYEKTDQETAMSEPVNAETINGPKFQFFSANDHFADSDQTMYRKERQAKHFDPSDIPRNMEKADKNFMTFLKWSKNKDLGSEIFPPGVQKNEAYPVNDDVADFALYMNKSNRRRSKSKGNANSQEGRFDKHVKRGYFPIDFSEKYDNSTNPDKRSPQYGTNLSDVLFEGAKIKKDTKNIVDDLVFSEGGAKILDNANFANSQRTLYDPYRSLTSLLKTSSVDDSDSDQLEISENQHGGTGIVSDVIREKTIILPEPLVFNSSHVVSSFVYTMIPFRSPLLNLLENDKHSKYIMIKIDPVLQPSKRINLSDQQLQGGNMEYELEQNVMKVIDKLIGSDLQWDFNSVEGRPRSKPKSRLMGSRHHRRIDENSNENIRPQTIDETNRFNGVVS